VLELGLKVFLSYLAGSLNGALLVGRLYGGVDIRRSGSGNAGATNALRTQGRLFAVLVMLVDVAKGVGPVVYFPAMVIAGVDPDPAIAREWLTYACGAAAIFGHCYPVWHQFVGGKGFATTLGVLGAVSPVLLIPVAMTWLAALIIAGYVGLATVLAAFSIPLYLAISEGAMNIDRCVFTLSIAVFIAYTHRSNLRKLRRSEGGPDISFSLLNRLG